MASNNFYRVVNIGAMVGREVLITAATGGVGGVVSGAGRVAGGLIVRYGGRAGVGVIQGALRMGALATPIAQRVGCFASTAQRIVAPVMLYNQIDTMTDGIDRATQALRRGDGMGAAQELALVGGQLPGALASFRMTRQLAGSALGLRQQSLTDFLTNCFAAGTPILWEGGSKAVEEFKPGDRVWARNETDAEAPAELREIEECYVNMAEIWHLHVGGQVIRTTGPHPFWVVGRGWVPTNELRAGDLLVGRDGRFVPIEDILATGVVETVYNFRVAEHHTYFVGSEAWQLDVWAHNSSDCVRNRIGALGEVTTQMRLGERFRGQNYQWLGMIQNNSGNGIDGVFILDGVIGFLEVKSSDGATARPLRGPQRIPRDRPGRPGFISSRVRAAIAGRGSWAQTPAADLALAQDPRVRAAIRSGNYLTYVVEVTNLMNGSSASTIGIRPW
jgi:hypothetical protein